MAYLLILLGLQLMKPPRVCIRTVAGGAVLCSARELQALDVVTLIPNNVIRRHPLKRVSGLDVAVV